MSLRKLTDYPKQRNGYDMESPRESLVQRLTARATRRGRVVLVIAGVAVAACGCASGASTATAAFTPQGGSGSTQASASPTASAPVAGLSTFAFPSDVKVVFQTPIPASGVAREATVAYENYIDAMWYGVYKTGAYTGYARYISGNALTFVKEEINWFASNSYHLSGTIVFSETSVPNVYSRSAVVESCVNASGLYAVSKSGKTIGTALPAKYDYYQEQATAGMKSGGSWLIAGSYYTSAAETSAEECAS